MVEAPDDQVDPLVGAASDDRTVRLVGYASCVREFDADQGADFLHLDCLYLDPPQRGAGIGGRLMTRVAAHARLHGCDTVRWQTPVWNADAVRFYERQGVVGIAATQFTATPETR